jgi:hypothetical protein
VQRRRGIRQQRLQQHAALGLRQRQGRAAVRRQDVERDEARGRIPGQPLHARGRGMQSLLQRVEVQAAGRRDHDLAVEDAARRQLLDQGVLELREVAVQRLEVAALQQEAVRVAESQRAKAVPLGFELEAGFIGQRVGDLGEHRFDRGCGHVGGSHVARRQETCARRALRRIRRGGGALIAEGLTAARSFMSRATGTSLARQGEKPTMEPT